VLNVGTDSSGRTIYMTRYMSEVWERIVAELGWRPTVVQGAFMVRNGGGATESAGYHDAGGCLDVRTWDMSADRLNEFIRVARTHAWAFWRRDANRGGMDPHAHGVLGSDYALARGALTQWQQYLNGRDGLTGNGADYEWRPSPLVTKPPEDDMPFTPDELRAIVRGEIDAALADLGEERITSPDDKGPKSRSLSTLLFGLRDDVKAIRKAQKP